MDKVQTRPKQHGPLRGRRKTKDHSFTAAAEGDEIVVGAEADSCCAISVMKPDTTATAASKGEEDVKPQVTTQRERPSERAAK